MTLKPRATGTGSEYVHETLGELRAMMAAMSKTVEGLAVVMDRTGGELKDDVAELKDGMQLFAYRLDKLEANYTSLRSGYDTMAPKLDSLIDQRNKAASWVVGVTSAAGAAWWLFGDYITAAAKALFKIVK